MAGGGTGVKLAYGEQTLVLGNIPDEQAVHLGYLYHPNDDEHVRHVIRCVIAPYFARWDDESKAEARKLWAEVIVKREEEWLILAWEADLPPVNLPDEPLRFAQILWEELFPGEDPQDHVPPPDAEPDPAPTSCNRMRVTPPEGPEILPNLLDLPRSSS